MAAAGYPMNPRKGDVITGLPKDDAEAMVFHAGTTAQDGQTLTSGRPCFVRHSLGGFSQASATKSL
jgi:phosphoribosylamine-glycine ligase